MRRLGSRVSLLALLCGCPGGASSEDPGADEAPGEGPSIVMVDFHPPDVAEPRVTWADKASGLLFTTPGRGWARIEGAELAALGGEVRLAVREGQRCSGWALARKADVSARQAADAARAALSWEGLAVQVDEFVKYDIWTARRYEVQGKLDGRTVSERATWWLDLGTLYAIVARSSEASYTGRRRCLDSVTAGFALGTPAP